MSEEQDIQDIEDSVKEAVSRGTFNIVEAIQGRAYPKQKTSVYLNENAAYRAAIIDDRLDEINKTLSKSKGNSKLEKERDELIEERDAYIKELGESIVTFHLRGISEGKRDELYAKAKKKYPIEYERGNDLAALAGQKVERTEKESPERDTLFTELLWLEQIEKVEDLEGNVQDSFTYSDVKEMRSAMPIAAIAAVNTAVDKLRVASAVFMQQTGEDFLAKP